MTKHIWGHNLVALDAGTGKTLWETMIGTGDLGPVVLSRGVLYAKGSDGYLYAIGNPLSFSATPTTGMTPLTVTFSDTTPQSTSGWSWDFGDGSTSTMQNPVHTYTKPGRYTVRLTANDASGKVSRTKENFIEVKTDFVISSLSPGAGLAGTMIPVTLEGGNFTGRLEANLTRSSAVIPVSGIVFLDSGNVTGTISVPEDAPIGLYDLSAVRKSDGTIVKVPEIFRVLKYPAPEIASIDPTSTRSGTLQQFSLSGSNFQAGATAAFGNSGGTKVAATAVSYNESEIILTTTFPRDGTGFWDVTVTNPDGGSATLQNALEVMPSNADSPSPSISSVTPSQGSAGMILAVTITGANFTKGSSVKLTRGPAEIPGSQIVLISAKAMRATFQVPGNAVPGKYDLVVVNNEGQAGMLAGAVMVQTRNPPVITALSPATMVAGSATSFALTGDRFQDGATVVFENTTHGALLGEKLSVTAKRITGTLSVPERAIGTWSVTVTNPDGGTSALRDALVVRSQQGDNDKVPHITSVKPSGGSAGKNVVLIIHGDNFTKGSTATLRNPSGDIPAREVFFISSKKMALIVYIPSTAIPGTYDIVITDSMGRSGTLPGAFTVLQ